MTRRAADEVVDEEAEEIAKEQKRCVVIDIGLF